MEQATIIGIDISKKSFQLHGATAEGEPVFRKTLSRGRFLAFLSEVPSCLVVMEACGGAHHWGRAIIDLGHECKLIPPVYVKPFVGRQKNDSNDAAAIVEAAQRPTMRFVAVKSEAAQSDSMLFRTRAPLVRQRTQTINSLRGHLAEFGVIAPLGPGGVEKLRGELEAVRESLPEQVASMATLLFTQVAALSGRIADLEKEIRVRARERADMKRLMTIPGVGPICAMAVHAVAPPMESFRSGRDFHRTGNGFHSRCGDTNAASQLASGSAPPRPPRFLRETRLQLRDRLTAKEIGILCPLLAPARFSASAASSGDGKGPTGGAGSRAALLCTDWQ
ncbi:MAG: IS110 family transposase [Boseongicola sp.]|nr:IS110 family transposase [Boseongicola sp.]